MATPTLIPSVAHTSMSKREFLAGAGAALTLGVVPLTVRRALAAEQWDLIVVGGGTAGLPAALFAAQRGARVLVLDKAPVLGGTLDRSGGQMAAAGTVFQKAKGIEDSPDAHYEDIMRINGHTSDPVLTRLLVDNAADSLNWLAANGFSVHDDHPVTGGGHEHFRTPRYQWGPESGVSIYKVMEPLVNKAVDSGKLTVMLGTGVVDLIQNSEGAIAGVVSEDEAGHRMDYQARYTLLASGGCAANPRMFEELHGVPLYCQVAYPYSQGVGLMLGLGAGGYLRGADRYASLQGTILEDHVFPSPRYVSPTLNPVRRPPWEILVNARAERFVQEDHPSVDHREKAVAQQPGHRHWAVFDQTVLDTAPPLIRNWTPEQYAAAFATHPMFTSAPSLGELGVKAGLNPSALRRTVEAYNHALAKGSADAFERRHRPVAIAKPPFYAIRIQGWTLMSFAGLAVNGGLQVVRSNGAPVPNLYAAGEVIGAGATSGGAYVNGMMVTPAVTFGRLLGQRLLSFA